MRPLTPGCLKPGRLLPDLGPARDHPAFRRLLAGGLLGLTFVPVLFVGLLGGAVADTVDRRKLALAVSGCLMAVSAAFAAQACAGPAPEWQVWLLYALAMVQAVLQAAAAPSRRTFTPRPGRAGLLRHRRGQLRRLADLSRRQHRGRRPGLPGHRGPDRAHVPGLRPLPEPDTLVAVELQVTDNPDKARFEIVADGELAGFAQYYLRDGQIAFTHTETDDRFRGHGLAGHLVQAALDAARERHLAVLPYCPFVKSWIGSSPRVC